MTPSKSVLLVASLASTLLPPRVAQGVVMAALLSLAAMAGWIVAAPGMVAGLVTDTFEAEPGGPAVATVAEAFSERAIQVASAAGPLPDPGDLIIASGEPRHFDGVGAFLVVTQQTVLPLAAWRAKVEALRAAVPLGHVHAAALVVAALGLVLFAPLVLRALAALGMAGLSVVWLAGAWHFNLIHVVVPLPPAALEPLMLGAAIVGAVAAWKAMADDPARLGLRFGAILMVPALLGPLDELTGLPAGVILLVLPLLAVLWPTLLSVAAALPLIAMALALTPAALAGAALVLAALRLWRDSRRGPLPVTAPPPSDDLPLDLETDARGAFDLARLVTRRPER